MSKIVEKACQFATAKHEGQTYGNGFPFIVHPQQVATVISQVTNDQKLIAAAWLHDTVEDTDTTYAELCGEFGSDVADLVMEVTHEGERDHIGFYFPRLKTQRGIMLKFADRLSNISHMENWPEAKRQHYLKRSKFWSDGTKATDDEAKPTVGRKRDLSGASHHTNEHKDQASKNVDELKEKLAAIEHERWSDWQKWCHKVLGENMPSDVFQDYVWPILIRWEKQADTAYKDLTDSEKASDMEQVDRYWPLIQDYLTQFTQELIEGLPDKPKYAEIPDMGPGVPYEFVQGYGLGVATGKTEAIDAATQSFKATLTKYTGGKS